MEKHRAIQSHSVIMKHGEIIIIIIKQGEITDQAEISKQIFSFCQSLFSRKVQNQTDKKGRI